MAGKTKRELGQGDFERLCSYGCTAKEMTDWFRASTKTIEAWCNQTYDGKHFSEVCDMFLSDTRARLRNKQIEIALAGNKTMLIWLGKQLLGQRDHQEMTLHDKSMTDAFVDSFEGLSHELKVRIMQELGGPPPDPEPEVVQPDDQSSIAETGV